MLLLFCFQDCWRFFLFGFFCLLASSFKNIVMFQSFASSTPSCSTPFQSIHEWNFALKIFKWDSHTKAMILVQCEICVYHGHKELVD
jgi:hypothetical protein